MTEPFSAAFDRFTGVLAVRGELDQATAHHVHALDFQGHPLRHIDCTGTSFISAAGVGALLARCEARPTTVAASPMVRRVIELCGLGDVLLMDNPGASAN